jgi:hypothetical protein
MIELSDREAGELRERLRRVGSAQPDQFAAYLESPHGSFELWYAERERRRKRA